jgi:hypothetical protein
MEKPNTSTPKNPVLAGFDTEFAPIQTLTSDPEPKPAVAKSDDEPPVEPKSEKKFRREIDLGDGGGKQVFEADTPEELLDKLADAQLNATRKIRELNRQVKRAKRVFKPAAPAPTSVADPEIKPLTQDEEFMLGAQFSQMPRKSFERLFEAVVGMKPSQFKTELDQVRAFKEAQDANKAAQEFLADHKDDYLPTPENYQAIQGFLDSHSLPMTRENLEEAFEELNESGLLEPPQPSTEEENDEGASEAKPVRIERKPQKPASSGLSDRRSARRVESPNEPATLTDDEIWNLPMDEARDRIVRSLHRGGPQVSR